MQAPSLTKGIDTTESNGKGRVTVKLKNWINGLFGKLIQRKNAEKLTKLHYRKKNNIILFQRGYSMLF